MGDNVVELVLDFSRALSSGEHASSTEAKLVFWDFLGLTMVRMLPCFTQSVPGFLHRP